MTQPRVLIFGTSYIGKGAQGYDQRVVDLWGRLATNLNLTGEFLVVDSNSPDNPREILPDWIEVYRFPDNIGHLNSTGQDGWGRAFCKGFEIAIDRDYDYIAHVDCDMIFTQPVMPIIEKMMRCGVNVACPMDLGYHFLETAILFVSVPYLKKIDFLGQYDWREPAETRQCVPEVRLGQIFADELFTLPIIGSRNDNDRITANNLKFCFPQGLSYLTHCKDFEVYRRLIEMNGVEL